MIEPIRLSFDLHCDRVHAWEVWTGRFGQWWPADHTVTRDPRPVVILEAVPGGRIYERTGTGVELDWGRVVVWKPPERLVYLWHLGRDPAEATEVEIRFLESEARTRVVIEHRGWERLAEDAIAGRDGNRAGWATLLPHYIAAAGDDMAATASATPQEGDR